MPSQDYVYVAFYALQIVAISLMDAPSLPGADRLTRHFPALHSFRAFPSLRLLLSSEENLKVTGKSRGQARRSRSDAVSIERAFDGLVPLVPVLGTRLFAARLSHRHPVLVTTTKSKPQ